MSGFRGMMFKYLARSLSWDTPIIGANARSFELVQLLEFWHFSINHIPSKKFRIGIHIGPCVADQLFCDTVESTSIPELEHRVAFVI